MGQHERQRQNHIPTLSPAISMPWYRDGDVELTIPGDWTPGTHNGYTGYFIRMNGGNGTLSADIGEMRTINPPRRPPTDWRIAAYFPPGWTLDASGRTAPRLMCGCSLPARVSWRRSAAWPKHRGSFCVGCRAQRQMAVQLRHQAGAERSDCNPVRRRVAMESNADVCLVMELTPTQDTSTRW